jgi:hypothetical protein
VPLLTYEEEEEEEEEEDFRRFPLQSMNQKSANSRISYAKQFDTVLEQVMLKACYNYHQRKGFMSRNHLRVYPSFWGCHNTTWVSLKRKYNLKWSSGKPKQGIE